MWAIGLCIVAATAQAPAVFDELDVLERAVSIGLTRDQAAKLVPLAERAARARNEYEARLSQIAATDGLDEVLAALYAGAELTSEQQQTWDAVKAARSNAAAALDRTMDTVYAPALTEFNAEQLFIIVDRHEQYLSAFRQANRLRTTPDSDWPRIRDMLAMLITDHEYYTLLSAAGSAWEQRTGRSSDVIGGGPTLAELGVEEELEAIRQAGQDYIQTLRARGATDAEIAGLAYRMLGRAIDSLRTWPPPSSYRYLGGRAGFAGIRSTDETHNASSHFFPGNMIRRFLDSLLAQPASAQTLTRLARG